MEDIRSGRVRKMVRRDWFGALVRAGLLCLMSLALAPSAFALDNPDAPNLAAQFEARAKKFETEIGALSNNSDITRQYAEYENFLDQELNKAYSALVKKLKGDAGKDLLQSQRKWIQFRDAEFQFIDANWTVENFGSSYALSRGGYRTKIIHDRVVELLFYLMNY